jgi:hypothetical protein
MRRLLHLSDALEAFSGGVTWGCVGGSRLHNLIVDLALPMAAAERQREGLDTGALEACWLCWWPGDAPSDADDALRASGLTGPGQPVCNGLVQAVLGEMLRLRRQLPVSRAE